MNTQTIAAPPDSVGRFSRLECRRDSPRLTFPVEMQHDSELNAAFDRLRVDDGEAAKDALLSMLYADLHGLARRHMARQKRDHTLQPTALVHEVYLKLRHEHSYRDRAQFLDLASTAMHRLLVDHARRKHALKRGVAAERLQLDLVVEQFDARSHGVIDLEDALDGLRAKDPNLARLVVLRFYGGSTIEEAAEVLGISPRQATRWWAIARAYLHRELGGD